METVNLAEKLALIGEYWAPKTVGSVNGFHVRLVKLKGEFVWHAHAGEDELFLVLEGTLRMQFRGREVAIGKGEFLVVPHGTEHRPVADDEVHVLLFEPASTVNTGTAGGDRTREVEWLADPSRGR
ncbi:MAG: cupin domain-containing protein [Rhodospirillaceae bacterium]